MTEQPAGRPLAKLGLRSGVSLFAAKLAVSMLFALFVASVAHHVKGGAALAATPQFNGHYAYEFGPGSVRLQGSAESLQLEVHDSTIAAVLAAMGRAFAVRYRSSTPLDDAISGTYVGSLGRVIARVLAGYDYVIKHQDHTVEVSVLGKHGEQALPGAPAVVAPVRQRRCGRSGGHQAACQPI
jgi:hypothetical protein